MKKVLAVEDNEAFAAIIKEALSRYDGIEVEVISDGAEAIERVEKATTEGKARIADLVLLDLDLPSANGFEVLESIRASETHRSLPVIILTHSDSEGIIEQAYFLGANSYLLKTDRLADTLHRVHEYWFELSRVPVRHP